MLKIEYPFQDALFDIIWGSTNLQGEWIQHQNEVTVVNFNLGFIMKNLNICTS